MNMPGDNTDQYSKGYKVFVFSAKTAVKVLFVVLLVVIIVFLARRAYSLGYEVSSYRPYDRNQTGDVAVIIKSDMSIRDVGELLIQNGILNESLDAFLIQERISDYHDQFRPGIYVLNPSLSVEEILRIISAQPDEEGDA